MRDKVISFDQFVAFLSKWNTEINLSKRQSPTDGINYVPFGIAFNTFFGTNDIELHNTPNTRWAVRVVLQKYVEDK